MKCGACRPAKGNRVARLALGALGCALLVHGAPASLPERISRLLDSLPAARTAFWGIQIVDLESGRTLYSLNQERFFVPASNAKLFTAALALSRLGPGHVFVTRVVAASAADAQGRLRGPLVLVGGGDPNLSGRLIPYRVGAPAGNSLAAIQDLADQIAARGVQRIYGGIVADDRLYVWQPYPEGWAVDDPLYEFGAPVSAFSVNDNSQALTIRPGARAGDLAVISLDPPIEFYQIDNRVRTVPAGGERKIEFERDPGSAQIRVWGTIPLRDPGRVLLVAIEDPARFAAEALRYALSTRGIAVDGPVTVRHLHRNEVPDPLRGPVTAEAPGVELAARVSAPLIEQLRVMSKVSQNLHAEMLLRAVGLARRQIGSREAGLEEMKMFLAEAGIDSGSFSIVDASGLTRLDLVTPAAVVQLLRYMHASAAREQWLSLLPVGGIDGTLGARFSDGAGIGRIFAKTGSLSNVSALSGYARRDNGQLVAFSILVNNHNGQSAEIRGIMDRIGTLIID